MVGNVLLYSPAATKRRTFRTYSLLLPTYSLFLLLATSNLLLIAGAPCLLFDVAFPVPFSVASASRFRFGPAAQAARAPVSR